MSETATAIVVSEQATMESYRKGLEPGDLDAAYRLSKAIAQTGLYGVRSAEDCLARLMTGREIGLTSMQSLRGLYSVDGKIGLDASLMHALSMSSPFCEQFECTSETPTSVTYTIRRRGWSTVQTITWTLEMAERAGLLNRGKDEQAKKNNNWTKYPHAMLHARCKADGARRVFPEKLFGLLSTEELRDIASDREPAPAASNPPPQLEAKPSPMPVEGLIQRIKAAVDKEERRKIRAEVEVAIKSGRLAGARLEEVQRAYNETVPKPQEPTAPEAAP